MNLVTNPVLRTTTPPARMLARPALAVTTLLAGIFCSAARAEIPEPDTIFYGRIVNRSSHQEYLLTQGTLSWTISRPDGKQITLSTPLTALNGGLYSYRLLVPQEALAYGLSVSPDVVPVGSQPANCSHVEIAVDGAPASIIAPGSGTFTVSQLLRASTYRLDLELFNPLPDSTGEGLPDWWRAAYGVTDPNADPDHDGWNNLQEFLHGSNPTNDNRIPSLLTRESLVFAGGATGIRLQSIDSDSEPTNLFYTLLQAPRTGILLLRNAQANPNHSDSPLDVGAVFTQDDVNRGRLVFQHQSSDTSVSADSLTVSLRDENPVHGALTNVVALSIYRPNYSDAVLQQAQSIAAAPAGFSDIAGLSFYEQQMLLNYCLARDHQYVIWDGSRGAAPQELRVPSSDLSAAQYDQYVAAYGPDRPQVLVAGAGGDHLVGGMENDLLIAGRGGDSLRGNGGADLFVIPRGATGTETIEDFNVSEKDALDISRVLTGSSTALSNYVQITRAGANSYIGVNFQGAGANFTDLVVALLGTQFTQDDLRSLVDSGSLITGNRALPDEISIVATIPGASQNGPVAGQFTLTRSGAADSPLTASLQITGSAVNGSDYQYLPSQVTFVAGQRTATLTVNPYLTSSVFTQIVQVAISPGAGYAPSSTSVAEVSIEPMLPQVSIQAIAPVASRLDQAAGVFLVTRGGVINNSVLVTLSIGGTASASHYNPIPTFLNFAPQQTTALISVTPRSNSVLSQSAESVQVTILPGSTYRLAYPASDRVLLVDQLLTFGLWQQKYFPGSTESANAFAGEDSGRTGIPNLLRYAYGLDPFAPRDAARFPTGRVFDDHLSLSFKRPPAVTDVNYVVEVSDDLINWRSTADDVEEYFPTASNNDLETVFFRGKQPASQARKLFMRVRVSLQQ